MNGQKQSILDVIEGNTYFKAQIQEQEVQTKKNNLKNRIQQLSKIISVKYPQTNINIQKDFDEDTYILNIPLESYPGNFVILFQIAIKSKEQDFEFKAFICDEDGKLQIHQKLLRLQVCRFALRLNHGLRVGSFFINPVFGDIGFNLQCINTQKDLFFNTNCDLDQFVAFLDNLIMTAIYSIRFPFLRIMFMINKINKKQFALYEKYFEQVKQKQQPQYNWKKIPKDAEIVLGRIKKIVKKQMHLEFSQQEYASFGPIIQKQFMVQNECLMEIIPVNQNDLQVNKECQINKGGFCNIYSKKISFKLKKNDGSVSQLQERSLVIKVDKMQQEDKIKKEVEIIKVLSQVRQDIQTKQYIYIKIFSNSSFSFSGCCPFIAQFYYLKDRSDILLMERYYHSSLDYFMVTQQEVLTLSTRIFIALNIAKGLRYIHNYGIIHTDIKPANIMISKTLIAKITDFGEAINTRNIIDGQRPGKTIPYCPPEYYQNLEANQLTYAYDIYSFGVLLFELLFDRYPIDFRIQKDKLQTQNYFVRYKEEYQKLVGPQYLMKYLGRLCIQCLQPDEQKRPNLDKIILVLIDSLMFLDLVY
ncbi:unnamed protein product [Paramecium primaurelia]|uniref:Protein kinase domain-containing protein n=1 Tax=Paramecium primaurelia TaxID=5886 RepID=A0A8S1QB47_PARPR|nr:unnamed protein product [Paramecium primaurelia]